MRLQSSFLRGQANPLAVIERRALQVLDAACAPPEEPQEEPQQRAPSADSRIERARRNPAEFRSMLTIEDDRNYGESLDPWQKQDLEAMDPAWRYCTGQTNVKPEYRHFYLERPRGHSKTTDIAIMAIWAVLSSPQRVDGYCAAATDDQAQLVIEAAARVINDNGWLADEIEVTTTRIVSKITGASCKAVPANAKALYGKLPAFTICDELSVWRDKAVLDALISGVPKVPRGMLIIISNAGYGKGSSWQWKRRELCRTSDRWYFHSLDGPSASWLSADDIDQQRAELDDLEFRRCWLNQWIKESAHGIPYDWVMNCTRLPGPCEAGSGHQYSEVLGALDIGLKNDRTSLVWLGVDLKRQALDLLGHRTWRPSDFPEGEVQLLEVGEVILRDASRIGNVSGLHADTWNAAMLLQKMELVFPCYEVQFGSGIVSRRLGKDFMGAFRNGLLRLYYDEQLETDIMAIEVEMGETNKRCRLVADRTEDGHADSAFALAIGTMIGTIAIEAGASSGETTGEQLQS